MVVFGDDDFVFQVAIREDYDDWLERIEVVLVSSGASKFGEDREKKKVSLKGRKVKKKSIKFWIVANFWNGKGKICSN